MSEVQSVLFDKKIWEPAPSNNWLKHHHLEPIKKVHITDDYLRYRINSPKKYKRFRTKRLSCGIKVVLGFKS